MTSKDLVECRLDVSTTVLSEDERELIRIYDKLANSVGQVDEVAAAMRWQAELWQRRIDADPERLLPLAGQIGDDPIACWLTHEDPMRICSHLACNHRRLYPQQPYDYATHRRIHGNNEADAARLVSFAVNTGHSAYALAAIHEIVKVLGHADTLAGALAVLVPQEAEEGYFTEPLTGWLASVPTLAMYRTAIDVLLALRVPSYWAPHSRAWIEGCIRLGWARLLTVDYSVAMLALLPSDFTTDAYRGPVTRLAAYSHGGRDRVRVSHPWPGQYSHIPVYEVRVAYRRRSDTKAQHKKHNSLDNTVQLLLDTRDSEAALAALSDAELRCMGHPL